MFIIFLLASFWSLSGMNLEKFFDGPKIIVENGNHDALVTRNSEGCAICHKDGHAKDNLIKMFPAKDHRAAHASCFEKIIACEVRMNSLFEDFITNLSQVENQSRKNQYCLFTVFHIALIDSVEKFIQSPLLDYYEKFGQSAMQRLFETTGNLDVRTLIEGERDCSTVKVLLSVAEKNIDQDALKKVLICNDALRGFERIYAEQAPFKVKNISIAPRS